ncbi:MAG: HD domain-containing protein [Clostridia bacterium]|nr:HD domain-containing protein [Clostridia bacterium]
MNEILLKAKENMLLKEKDLSEYACKSEKGIWLREDKEDIRPIFYRDIDRIIHSSGYTRYIDKTQVYSFVQNDHITRRVLHVQLVAKIARTIGRSLRLNEDLIEAMALGHDIGHTPFGHKGESILNDICKEENIGAFCHNAQSVRELQTMEGLNISLQTLDGILAHNGEILINKYTYNPNKTKEEFIGDLQKTFEIDNYSKQIRPMTLEGCVVRLSDILAYIGRDIEDAIKVGVITRNDIPQGVAKILGNTNSSIVDTLIKDVIINSYNKPYLMFSDEVFVSLMKLKDWNYKTIYESDMANKNYEKIDKLFKPLYKKYLEKLQTGEYKTLDGKDFSEKNLYEFIRKMSKYPDFNIKRAVIDYIAGQTDKFFLNECKNYLGLEDVEKLYN